MHAECKSDPPLPNKRKQSIFMSGVSATTSITLEYTGANERDTVIVIIVFFCQTHCGSCCFGELKSSCCRAGEKVKQVKTKINFFGIITPGDKYTHRQTRVCKNLKISSHSYNMPLTHVALFKSKIFS